MNTYGVVPPDICKMIQDTDMVALGLTEYVWVLAPGKTPMRHLRDDTVIAHGKEEIVDSYTVGDLMPSFGDGFRLTVTQLVDKRTQYVVHLGHLTIQADLFSGAIGIAFYQRLFL